MKSKFFKDTNGLGECYTRCPPGRVIVCLRMDQAAYGRLLEEAGRLGMTSGDYIGLLLDQQGSKPPEPEAAPLCREAVLQKD